MRHLIAKVTLGSLFVLAPSILSAQSYSTSFPLTENPISEGGNWTNGKTVGVDWSDIRTTPGLAFGTQDGFTNYTDSIAVLRGPWGADQTATATVHTVNQQSGSTFEEVELLLRFSISGHTASGYEVNFSCRHDGTQYTQIVRWNGPIGNFTLLDSRTGPGLADGDQVKATIVGSTITTYINNVPTFVVTDSTFTSGGPGMGFYLQGGTAALAGDYGFTKYTATSGTATVPLASFTAKLEIHRSHRPTLHANDTFEVEGRGMLGAASHGIAPDAEDVTLSLGPFSLTIPAGSFVKKVDKDDEDRDRDKDNDGKDKDKDLDKDHDRKADRDDLETEYVFKGVIDGVSLEATIEQLPDKELRFEFEGRGADLSGVSNPVKVGLAIGDDAGSAVVHADID
jgi:hypothetical protein